MILGYNTNGFAHHRLDDAVEVIADLGYGGVALTPDVNHADPTTQDMTEQFEPVLTACRRLRLAIVVETGARFTLDRRRKHRPTLLTVDRTERQRRFDLLTRHVNAAYLSATRGYGGLGVVSFWSGTPDTTEPPADLMDRLVDHCLRLADYAAGRNVRLAFEPEPGMFIDTMDKFAELHARVDHPAFGLTIDIGHLVCNGELPVSEHLVRWKDWLWNVHIEDMRCGVHDHLMFGEGEVDFADVFAGLRAADYRGMVSVELSRHSHDAVNVARRSMEFLKRYV